jgi:hypothetical protein
MTAAATNFSLSILQSKKSNSLGNFDFMHKHDIEQHDSISISSGTSNEHKKKEKVW